MAKTNITMYTNAFHDFNNRDSSSDSSSQTYGNQQKVDTYTQTILLILLCVWIFVMIALNGCCSRHIGEDINGNSTGEEDRQRQDIENMLINKAVIVHVPSSSAPQTGNKQENTKENEKQEPDTQRIQRKKSNLVLLEDDETKELLACPICLNEYQDGEQISWSRNAKCDHAFHHDCIQAWLLKNHHECPCCRCDYIVDPPPENDSAQTQDEEISGSTAQSRSESSLDTDVGNREERQLSYTVYRLRRGRRLRFLPFGRAYWHAYHRERRNNGETPPPEHASQDIESGAHNAAHNS